MNMNDSIAIILELVTLDKKICYLLIGITKPSGW